MLPQQVKQWLMLPCTAGPKVVDVATAGPTVVDVATAVHTVVDVATAGPTVVDVAPSRAYTVYTIQWLMLPQQGLQ